MTTGQKLHALVVAVGLCLILRHVLMGHEGMVSMAIVAVTVFNAVQLIHSVYTGRRKQAPEQPVPQDAPGM